MLPGFTIEQADPRVLCAAGGRLKLTVEPLILPANGSEPLWKNIPHTGFKLVSHTVLDGRTLIL